MEQDPRRSIAKLAVAVMTADGRITASEYEALQRLNELGLGPLAQMAEVEICRAVHEPIDVRATCADLINVGPRAAAVIVAALAEVAVSDRELAAAELETLREVAAYLGLTEDELAEILEVVTRDMVAPAAISTPAASQQTIHPKVAMQETPQVTPRRAFSPPVSGELARAYRLVGLEPGATLPNVEAAYLAQVDRYNPAKVTSLGADFAALAVRKLTQLTAAFETIRAAMDSSAV